MQRFEQWLENHPRLALSLIVSVLIFASCIAGRDNPENQWVAYQQRAEMQAWEQGYEQGQYAKCTRLAVTQEDSHATP